MEPANDTADGDHHAKHGDLDATLGAHAVNVAPCHFFHTARLSDEEYAAGEYDTEHSCVQVKLGNALTTVELDFANPVTINAEQHHLLIELMSHYESWFDGIVMNDLESVTDEQDKLMQSIGAYC